MPRFFIADLLDWAIIAIFKSTNGEMVVMTELLLFQLDGEESGSDWTNYKFDLRRLATGTGGNIPVTENYLMDQALENLTKCDEILVSLADTFGEDLAGIAAENTRIERENQQNNAKLDQLKIMFDISDD